MSNRYSAGTILGVILGTIICLILNAVIAWGITAALSVLFYVKAPYAVVYSYVFASLCVKDITNYLRANQLEKKMKSLTPEGRAELAMAQFQQIIKSKVRSKKP